MAAAFGKLADEEMDQLETWIGAGPKQFTLLYSATRDGCVATTFHQKCDNQGGGGVLRLFSDALGLLPIRRRGIQMVSFY